MRRILFISLACAGLGGLMLALAGTWTFCGFGWIVEGGFNAMGHCSASDPPSEPFLGFLLVGAVLGGLVGAIAALKRHVDPE